MRAAAAARTGPLLVPFRGKDENLRGDAVETNIVQFLGCNMLSLKLDVGFAPWTREDYGWTDPS